MLHHHGGVSPTRQIGRDSSASWRVLDGPGFFHLTFLHSTNLHGTRKLLLLLLLLLLLRNADAGLFRSICSNPDHVLRRCFTDKRPTGHNLRPRAHSFALPSKDPRNFVSRTLYGALLNRD